jgi:HD-GYP domain-containing protein (c-di-GMP phosphodiesterase class II)
MLSIIAFCIISAGGFVMVLAALAYDKLLEYYKQESYQALPSGWIANSILFYFFITGFVLGMTYVLINEISLMFTLTSVLFLFFSVYAYSMVKSQATIALMFRNKMLEAIRAFVDTIDLKDYVSRGHSRQVYDIVNLLCDQLQDHRQVLNRTKLLDAAILHDIGKINIPLNVYNKRGQLSSEEWEIVKSHPMRGKEMLDNTFFREISDWVKYHHERVDGNGYYGIASENIPLESKIITIADTYSALRSERPYRPPLNHDEAIAVITRNAGKQFDRRLVERFLHIDKAALEEAVKSV